ncbi:DUF5777 family beta-barrel protein [Nannocystis sp. SCPEA4]|uniref:DUF5777 family beta-barrel protein n=1 Tax=Nannocystis sp. SCPEA4 TaxID=2996787 RepID=UPI00226F5A92|nr:DUF5777 family beta-barrel protein [Nannocystis sp. SCPEA4]MCY1056477.1 DUF5777 family beta-barrel protein [Nannocystis sp. SCPEA4]
MLPPPPLVLAVVTALAPASDLEAKVKAIFEDSCTACHDDGADEVSLAGPPSRLTSVKSKATGKAMVVAGDPDASYLYAKIVGAKGISGESMPPGDSLAAAQKKTIKDWIAGMKPASAPAPAATPTPAAPVPSGSSGGAAGNKRADLEVKVRKLFDDKCSACHESGGSEVVLVGDLGHLSRDKSKDANKRFVVPGDPDSSYLVNKLTGKNIKGDIMPMGDDPLKPAEIELVRSWIAALGESPEAGAGAAVETPPYAEGPETGGGEAGGADGGEGGKAAPERGKPPFHGTFQINLPTTTTLGRRTFEFRIDHRFGQVGAERGAFGLDAGANISYGFAYGILNGWDVLIRRTNSRKGYELGTKYIPIRQEDGKKLSFGGYASVEYLRDFPSNTANPWAGNFQLLLSRLWFDRWSTQLTVGYHLRTNHSANVQVDLPDDDVNGPVKVRDKRGTLGIGIASTVWLGQKKRWGIDLEYHLPIPADVFFYRGGNADRNGSNIGSWAIGGSVNTGKHFFQIFITNTREIHTNLYAPGGQSKNPFTDRGNFFFGFNLSRKWSL